MTQFRQIMGLREKRYESHPFQNIEKQFLLESAGTLFWNERQMTREQSSEALVPGRLTNWEEERHHDDQVVIILDFSLFYVDEGSNVYIFLNTNNTEQNI